MLDAVPAGVQALLKDAASRLTGAEKRAFMAKTTQELFAGSARRAETYFGWNRSAVQVGLEELRSGIRCVDNYQARGNKKVGEKREDLEQAIRELVDEHSQADPQLKTPLAYTRLSAAAVHTALIEQKGYTPEELPTVRTLSTILNRLGYRLRKVQKTKPQKNCPRPMPSSPM